MIKSKKIVKKKVVRPDIAALVLDLHEKFDDKVEGLETKLTTLKETFDKSNKDVADKLETSNKDVADKLDIWHIRVEDKLNDLKDSVEKKFEGHNDYHHNLDKRNTRLWIAVFVAVGVGVILNRVELIINAVGPVINILRGLFG